VQTRRKAAEADCPQQAPSIVPPPLKWAGAKTKIVARILALMPPETARLIEPFAGSAVVSINAGTARLLVADANPDLIALHEAIRDRPKQLIRELQRLFVPKNNTQQAYSRLRTRFNERRLPDLEQAALFVYLNRHGYNGLCRYNARGDFNSPFGRVTSPFLPETRILHASRALKHADITCESFEAVMREAGEWDFVYCDPPYSPLSITSNFTQYSAGRFGVLEHQALAQAAARAREAGAVVAISNHDTPETRLLYAAADEIHSFQVSRTISCDGANRKKVQELIAVYRPRQTGGRRRPKRAR